MMRTVMIVQLPSPRMTATDPTGNVPLAAGTLADAVNHAKDLSGWQAVPLPQATVDRIGDQGLIRLIETENPDAVGFSASRWEDLLEVEFVAQTYPIPIDRHPRVRIRLETGREEDAIAAAGSRLSPEAVPNQCVVMLEYDDLEQTAFAAPGRLFSRWQSSNPFGQFDLLLAPDRLPLDEEVSNFLSLLQPNDQHFHDRSLNIHPEGWPVVSRRLGLVWPAAKMIGQADRIRVPAVAIPIFRAGALDPVSRAIIEELPNVIGGLDGETLD